MLANPVPPARASTEEAQRDLDRVEELVAELDAGRSAADLRGELDALVSAVGEVAAAAAVGVPDAAATLMSAIVALVEGLRDRRAGRDDEVLEALERMRAGLLDLIESQPVRRDLPASELLSWLDGALASDRAELASILGTSRRSLQRWLGQPQAIPAGIVPRIRLIARLTNQLRFAYDGGPAIGRWFLTPKRGLDGRRPIDILDDTDAFDVLAPIALGARFA